VVKTGIVVKTDCHVAVMLTVANLVSCLELTLAVISLATTPTSVTELTLAATSVTRGRTCSNKTSRDTVIKTQNPVKQPRKVVVGSSRWGHLR